MFRTLSSSRTASRAGVLALSVATATALAIPAASAEEEVPGESGTGSTSESSALPSSESSDSSGSSADLSSGTEEGSEAPAGGISGGDIVSSLANTDWSKLAAIITSLVSGTVSSSTLGDIVSLSSDAEIGLGDVIGSIAGGIAGSSSDSTDGGDTAAE